MQNQIHGVEGHVWRTCKWWWNVMLVAPAVQISKRGRAGYNWFTNPLEVDLGISKMLPV